MKKLTQPITEVQYNLDKKAAFEKIEFEGNEFLGNKIADTVTNSYDEKYVKTKSVQEIIIPPEKREEISNELRHHKNEPL